MADSHPYLINRFRRVHVCGPAMLEGIGSPWPDGVVLVGGHYEPSFDRWELTLWCHEWDPVPEGGVPPLASMVIHAARAEVRL